MGAVLRRCVACGGAPTNAESERHDAIRGPARSATPPGGLRQPRESVPIGPLESVEAPPSTSQGAVVQAVPLAQQGPRDLQAFSALTNAARARLNLGQQEVRQEVRAAAASCPWRAQRHPMPQRDPASAGSESVEGMSLGLPIHQVDQDLGPPPPLRQLQLQPAAGLSAAAAAERPRSPMLTQVEAAFTAYLVTGSTAAGAAAEVQQQLGGPATAAAAAATCTTTPPLQPPPRRATEQPLPGRSQASSPSVAARAGEVASIAAGDVDRGAMPARAPVGGAGASVQYDSRDDAPASSDVRTRFSPREEVDAGESDAETRWEMGEDDEDENQGAGGGDRRGQPTYGEVVSAALAFLFRDCNRDRTKPGESHGGVSAGGGGGGVDEGGGAVPPAAAPHHDVASGRAPAAAAIVSSGCGGRKGAKFREKYGTMAATMGLRTPDWHSRPRRTAPATLNPQMWAAAAGGGGGAGGSSSASCNLELGASGSGYLGRVLAVPSYRLRDAAPTREAALSLVGGPQLTPGGSFNASGARLSYTVVEGEGGEGEEEAGGGSGGAPPLTPWTPVQRQQPQAQPPPAAGGGAGSNADDGGVDDGGADDGGGGGIMVPQFGSRATSIMSTLSWSSIPGDPGVGERQAAVAAAADAAAAATVMTADLCADASHSPSPSSLQDELTATAAATHAATLAPAPELRPLPPEALPYGQPPRGLLTATATGDADPVAPFLPGVSVSVEDGRSNPGSSTISSATAHEGP